MNQRYVLTVKTQAKVNEVVQLSSNELRISVTVPKRQGKANEAVVELIANFLKIPKWKVQIISGFKSPHKVVEVID